MSDPHRRLYLYSLLAWAMNRLLMKWPLLLIAAFFLSPVGPHLLWEYHYRGSRDVRFNCSYIGSRGLVHPGYVEGCPYIAWLDARGGAGR